MKGMIKITMVEVLFEGVVIFVCLIITGYIVPYLKQMIDKQQNEMLDVLVQIAVQYAEQCYETGKEKKAIVIEFLRAQLLAKNISITDEQLNALIESAVYILKQNALKEQK